jgi:hypothetical protein
MTSKGIKVIDTPVGMVDQFRKDAEAVWKDLVGKVYTQEELDKVLKIRDEYRASKGGAKAATAK